GTHRLGSVRACPDRLLPRLAAAHDAAGRRFRCPELLERKHADRRLRLFLHPRLALRRAAPAGVDEAARPIDDLPEPPVVLDAAIRVLLPPPDGRGEHRLLDRLETGPDAGQRLRLADGLLAQLLAVDRTPDEDELLLRHVTRTDLDPERHALALPLVELRARRHPLPRIEVHTHAVVPERLLRVLRLLENERPFLVPPIDRDDHDLVRREAGRDDQAGVVPVRHDQAADQPGRDAPRRVPRVLLGARLALELEIELTREVLAQHVRRPRLERTVVLHERLTGVRADRAGEPLRVRLPAEDRRHRHPVVHEVAIDAEHPPRLFLGLRFGRVRGVPLLPQELRSAEEEPRAHLPADHVRPLVDQEREIAVALDPLREHRIDDRLRR